MARHIILENGSPVNIDSLLIAYRESGQYYMMISGVDGPSTITERDFQAICDAVKKQDRPGKDVAAEISHLTLAIHNLYELLRARMR